MTMNGKFTNLLKAEKKPLLKRRNVLFYSIIGVSIVLLIIFFASLGYSNIEIKPFSNYSFVDVTKLPLDSFEDAGFFSNESYGTTEAALQSAGIIVTLPMWGIGVLISSSVGFGSAILGSTLNKTMLLENKEWLRIWSKKGKITSYYLFKRVQINFENNRISILKIGHKYRFKIPVTEGLNLNKFGFRIKNNFYIGYFVKEELVSTIHLLTTQI